MTDKLTKTRRSWNMSRITGNDTKPEILIRKELHRKGFRYRLKYKLTGKPDLVFLKQKSVVFVHGCFWHQHGCSNTYRPKTNKKFWNTKLDSNIARDKKVKEILESQGWNTLYIWECEIEKSLSDSVEKILNFLNEKSNNSG
ncbi:DNA mismatch endonuclease Vsr [Candidatus Dojkabacteria bacterium]|nr:DNA mismatch endonuclease Vsr [Candidatus Dojkabacteria bacterium]